MRTLMVVLLMICAPAFAAAPAHSCYPSLTNPPEHTEALDAKLSNGATHWSSWRCPDGTIYVDVFDLGRMIPLVIKAALGTLTADEIAAAHAAWPKTTKAEADEVNRRVAVNYYGAQPVVLTPVAYKQTKRVNQPPAQTRIGTVPVGTPCALGGKYGTLMLIDRDKVKMDSSIALKPETAWAVCG